MLKVSTLPRSFVPFKGLTELCCSAGLTFCTLSADEVKVKIELATADENDSKIG